MFTIDEEHFNGLLLKAEIEVCQNQYTSAEKSLDDLINGYCNSFKPHIFKANLLRDSGNTEAAIKIYDGVLKESKDISIKLLALVNKGFACLFIQNFNNALSCFSDADKLNIPSALLIQGKALTFFLQKKFLLATAMFSKAKSLTGSTVYDIHDSLTYFFTSAKLFFFLKEY